MTNPDIRATDQQRTDACTRLGEYLAVGCLDVSEYDQRVSVAVGARTVGEINALFTDLPDLQQGGSLSKIENHAAPTPSLWKHTNSGAIQEMSEDDPEYPLNVDARRGREAAQNYIHRRGRLVDRAQSVVGGLGMIAFFFFLFVFPSGWFFVALIIPAVISMMMPSLFGLTSSEYAEYNRSKDKQSLRME